MRFLLPATDVAVLSRASVACRAARKVLAGAFLLLLAAAALVRGQSPLDGFDPKPNGEVRIVVVQPDGKILLGGLFTALSPNGGTAVARNGVARLNPDGTLDAAFDAHRSGTSAGVAFSLQGVVWVFG